MDYRFLRQTGLKVSELCLCAMTLGREVTEDDGHQMLDRFVAAGGNFIDLSRDSGWEPFSCLQPLYNLLGRSTERELLPVCRREGLGVIPWSPFAAAG